MAGDNVRLPSAKVLAAYAVIAFLGEQGQVRNPLPLEAGVVDAHHERRMESADEKPFLLQERRQGVSIPSAAC